jgi:hypothetical protein
MPISESDFGKGGRDTSLVLLEFLSYNYRSAYTVDELVEAMATKGKDLAKNDVEALLSALVYGGRAESKTVDGVAYYKYARVEGMRVI